MKLILPNGTKTYLDTRLAIYDRYNVVCEILSRWEDYFQNNWNLYTTKICIDILSTYLCTGKEEEQKYKEDKFVMSVSKFKKMQRGNGKQINFTDLDETHKQLFGLIDNNEDTGMG